MIHTGFSGHRITQINGVKIKISTIDKAEKNEKLYQESKSGKIICAYHHTWNKSFFIIIFSISYTNTNFIYTKTSLRHIFICIFFKSLFKSYTKTNILRENYDVNYTILLSSLKSVIINIQEKMYLYPNKDPK